MDKHETYFINDTELCTVHLKNERLKKIWTNGELSGLTKDIRLESAFHSLHCLKGMD